MRLGGGSDVIALPRAAILFGLPVVILFAGCANARPLTQAELDVMADSCGLPHSAMILHGKNVLQFQPPENASVEAIGCALQKIKESKFPDLKMGFVGNERYSNEVEHNAQKN